MRKIINATFASLDGVIDNPHDWQLGDPGPRAGELRRELLSSCDAMLLGRLTYDAFAAAWPAMAGDPYGDRMNSMSKYVVSSTLKSPQWNNTTVVDGDPVAALTSIKGQPGQNIVQFGFGRLARTLMRHGLLDEVQLWIHPVFVGGSGPPAVLYQDGPTTYVNLVDSEVLKNGIVVLTYELQPRPDEAPGGAR